jgi:hypothetical protein
MVVYYSEALSQSGPMVQRRVILPPFEAGSDRCSVKPASRRSCRSRSSEAQAFARAPVWSLLNLEWAGQQSHAWT